MEENETCVCGICLELKSVNEQLFLSDCKCCFCRQCLVKYIVSVIYDRIDAHCPCPNYECVKGGELTDLEIQDLLSPNLYERYCLKKVQREIEHDFSLTFCPTIGCGVVCRIPSPTLSDFRPNVNPFSNVNVSTKLSGYYHHNHLYSHTHHYPSIISMKNNIGRWSKKSSKLTQSNTFVNETNNNKEVYHINVENFVKPMNEIIESSSVAVATVHNLVPSNNNNSSNNNNNNIKLDKHSSLIPEKNNLCNRPAVRVLCSQCGFEFCSRCHLAWHTGNPPFVCEISLQSNKNLLPFKIMSFKSKNKKKSSIFNSKKLHKSIEQSNSINLIKNEDSSNKQNPADLFQIPNGLTSNNDNNSNRNDSSIKKKDKNKLSFAHSKFKSNKEHLKNHSKNSLFNQNSLTNNVDLNNFPVGFPPYSPDAWLKRCPACLVPIERIEGCAQMMCRSCKHTFCWYCLTSLDDDFLLQHYDDGACKGKLGHSRASIIGHRVYVISVFTGLTILLLVAAPFIMVAVPCIICAKCHRVYHRYRLRKRHTEGLFVSNNYDPQSEILRSYSDHEQKQQQQQKNSLPEQKQLDFEPQLEQPCNSVNNLNKFNSSEQLNSFNKLFIKEKVNIHWPLVTEDYHKSSSSHHSSDQLIYRSLSLPLKSNIDLINSKINYNTP